MHIRRRICIIDKNRYNKLYCGCIKNAVSKKMSLLSFQIIKMFMVRKNNSTCYKKNAFIGEEKR